MQCYSHIPIYPDMDSTGLNMGSTDSLWGTDSNLYSHKTFVPNTLKELALMFVCWCLFC